jgi:CRISPR-associated protein Cas2
MDLVVTYDVNTLTKEGRRRLRRVAKLCEGHGQRVQESVFEVSVNEVQREKLMIRLLDVINEQEDSLRIYVLRGGREGAATCHGLDRYINLKSDTLLI